jgi:ELWxxDGT repeat protein
MSSRSILGIVIGIIAFILVIFACVALYRWINPPTSSNQPAAAVLPAPSMTITPQPNIYKAANEVITYNYVVTNNGTSRLAGPVTVTDDKVPNVKCPEVRNFEVGQTITCTGTYTVTQADVDNTFMTNTAKASAGGLTSLPATATIKLNPVLSLTASTNTTTYCQAGQNISFTYTITNTGTAALGPAQFIVRNDHIPTPINCGANNTTLATNQGVSCNTVYTTTANDAAAAQIVISSVASGGGAGSIQPAVSTIQKNCNTGPTTVPITPGAMVTHVVTPGDWLLQISRCYGASFPAVRSANPQVVDPNVIYPSTIVKVPNVGSVGKIYGPPCMIWYTVVSGDTWQSIATSYNADVDIMKTANPTVSTLKAGIKIKVPVNSAGGPPVTPVTPYPPTSAPPPPNTVLKLTVSTTPGFYTAAGQIINFNYTITNVGTTNLGPTQFVVQDSIVPSVICPANVALAPNQSIACSGSYMTTQTDVNATRITSSATASGGGAQTSQPVVTTIPYTPLPATVPTSAPQPIRLTFPAGNPSSLSTPGTITTPGTTRYVFTASGGQALNAQLIVPTNDVNMAIYGPNNTTLKAPDATNTWNGTLPTNGDYYIDLISSVGIPSKTYTLNLTLSTTAPPSNTVRVADINPGPNSSKPSWLSPFNAQLYFQANGNTNTGEEFWKYDLSTNTASMVADIFPGPPGSKPASLRPYQNMLYFGADGNDQAGNELWRFNGSAWGRVADIYPGTGSSNPMYMTEYNGELYFSANGNNGAGIELWKFNGSTSASNMAYDINPGPGNSNPSYLTVYNGLLYFAATTTEGGTELWKFDGTKATLASDIAPGATNSSPAFLAVYNNLLYFSANGNNGAGTELWKFDGTTPSMAYDINPGPADSAPTYMTVYNNALFFGALGNGSGFELWKFDGTTPSMAADVNPGAPSSNPAYLAVYNNVLYFQADGGDGAGAELWKYTGP